MSPFKKLLTPSVIGLILYGFIAMALIAGSNLTPIISKITTQQEQTNITVIFHQYSDPILKRIDQTGGIGSLTNFLLWVGFGAILYMIAWMITNAYIAFRNDIVIGATFTSIDTHGYTKYWLEWLSRGIFRMSSMLLTALLTNLVIFIWLPFSSEMFGIWVDAWTGLSHWSMAISALLGWMVVLHLYVIFIRLALLRTRVFN